MIRSILNAGAAISLFVFITGQVGCGNKSSTSSQRGAVRANQGYCDPNYSRNCNLQGMNGINNNNLNISCGTNNVMTDYGCRPRGSCPANYGFDQQTNQCLPAAQYNNANYNQQYYQNGYNQNSDYNNPNYYDQNYYNQNYYNQYNQNYYDPYQSNYYGY
jgi:hypothetical protein